MASIHSAAKCGDVDLIEYKLNSELNLDVNAQDGIGNGILHLSARFGHKELLEMLYVNYAKRFPFNPFLRNDEGKTALELAIEFDHADCTGILSKFPHPWWGPKQLYEGYTESVVNGFSAFVNTGGQLKQTHTKTESALCVADAPEGPRIHHRYAENGIIENIQRLPSEMRFKEEKYTHTIVINEKMKWEKDAQEAAMAELKGEVQVRITPNVP
jgi:hypothetical protein